MCLRMFAKRQRSCLLVPCNCKCWRGSQQSSRLRALHAQGLTQLGLRPQQVTDLLAHAANMAALYSLFVGQLPPAPAAQAAKWLAEAGLLGRLVSAEGDNAQSGQPAAAAAAGSSGDSSSGSSGGDRGTPGAGHTADSEAVVPRLFSAQQQRLSLPQMRLYNSHLLEGQDGDEDFEGNFS